MYKGIFECHPNYKIKRIVTTSWHILHTRSGPVIEGNDAILWGLC